MRGVISITDWDWFQFLSTQPNLDEINFWRPSDKSRPHLEPGTPIMFKLKQVHGGWIVGYGIFAAHSVQPAWVAWEALEQKNGAPSFAGFHDMLSAIRSGKGIDSDPAGNYEIGCIMLSAPVFLDRQNWIRPPSDWPRSGVMQGKSYDLLTGEGARVWQACLAATPAALDVGESVERIADDNRSRYGQAILVAPRLGQGAFRFAVTDAYGRACAVTTEHSLPVLEAAHIRPYSENGPHSVRNGLLLRTDIHRLFDKGYVSISPDDRRFIVSRRLNDDYENGKTYYALKDTPIHEPPAPKLRPGREFLEWHVANRFRG